MNTGNFVFTAVAEERRCSPQQYQLPRSEFEDGDQFDEIANMSACSRSHHQFSHTSTPRKCEHSFTNELDAKCEEDDTEPCPANGKTCLVCNVYLCSRHYNMHVDDCVEKYLNTEFSNNEDERADDGGWMHQDSEPEESTIEGIFRAHRSKANVKDLLEKEEEAWSDVELPEVVQIIQSENRLPFETKKNEDISEEWERNLYLWEDYVRAEEVTQEDEVFGEPEEDPIQISIEECFLGIAKKKYGT